MRRIIVYGDIHGCLEELIELRESIKPKASDIEVCVGDFLSKGPFSLQTLQFCRKNHIRSVLGNHEYRFLCYKKMLEYRGEIDFYVDEVFWQLNREDFAYLFLLPFYIRIANLTILHGGITNEMNLSLALQEELVQTLCVRYLSKKEHVQKGEQIQNGPLWSEVYDGHEGFVVYGHHPFLKPRIDNFAIGIDTGCVYGNMLTAAVFEYADFVDVKNPLFLQTPAKRAYCSKVLND